MTKNQKKEQDEALKLEIASRKELVKRLTHPMELLNTAKAKEKAKREQRAAELSEYRSENDIMDAYGWEFITEKEKDELIERFRGGEDYVENTTTKVSIACDILKEFIGRLEHEISGFEFELLPPEKQIKILEDNEKIRQKREARRAALHGQ